MARCVDLITEMVSYSVTRYLQNTLSNIPSPNRAVDELASVTPGKEARAMTSFANALR